MEKFDTYKKQITDGYHSHTDREGEITSCGNYKDGLEDGKWIIYDEFGEILGVTYYKNGNPCQIISNKHFSCDEEQYDYDFSDDELEEIEEEKIIDGKLIEKFPGREVSSIKNYKAGKLHGRAVSYYDGIPMIGYGMKFCEGFYKAGKKHGRFTWFNKNGSVLKEEIYKDDHKKKRHIAIINLSKIQENLDKKKISPKNKLDLSTLKKCHLVGKKYNKLKILGAGDIKEKFDVEVNFISNSAKEKIEKSGGKVSLIK